MDKVAIPLVILSCHSQEIVVSKDSRGFYDFT